MNFLTSDEIKKEELNILIKTVEFLEKNNIKYMLCGGTLLGAIRHKGFIPWDDDIDIFIPRPDYERMQQIVAQNGVNFVDSLYLHSAEQKNSNCVYTKIYNHDIYAVEPGFKDKNEKYLWVDVFPIDGFSDDYKKSEKSAKKYKFLQRLILLKKRKTLSLLRGQTLSTKIKKLVQKAILGLVPITFLRDAIIKNAKKFGYEKCKFAGDNIWGYGICERMDKTIFEDLIDVEFEGHKFKAPRRYDEYLTNIYGDYMKLPPKDKRKSHGLKAWRIDD